MKTFIKSVLILLIAGGMYGCGETDVASPACIEPPLGEILTNAVNISIVGGIRDIVDEGVGEVSTFNIPMGFTLHWNGDDIDINVADHGGAYFLPWQHITGALTGITISLGDNRTIEIPFEHFAQEETLPFDLGDTYLIIVTRIADTDTYIATMSEEDLTNCNDTEDFTD